MPSTSGERRALEREVARHVDLDPLVIDRLEMRGACAPDGRCSVRAPLRPRGWTQRVRDAMLGFGSVASDRDALHAVDLARHVTGVPARPSTGSSVVPTFDSTITMRWITAVAPGRSRKRPDAGDVAADD
jgi:hypothetical protein